jgi:Alpha-L-arabinofuranosidase C-terminal domain
MNTKNTSREGSTIGATVIIPTDRNGNGRLSLPGDQDDRVNRKTCFMRSFRDSLVGLIAAGTLAILSTSPAFARGGGGGGHGGHFGGFVGHGFAPNEGAHSGRQYSHRGHFRYGVPYPYGGAYWYEYPYDGDYDYDDGEYSDAQTSTSQLAPSEETTMLVNVNPGASQWPTNLIGYDALESYGSPSYYVQKMFSRNHGEVVLPATLTTTGSGSQLYESVTRDSRTGPIYLKVVNAASEVQPVQVTIRGVGGIEPAGNAVVLTADSPQDTNTLSDPRKIVPVTTRADGLGQTFEYRFKPYSITVLEIGVRHEHYESHGDADHNSE